MVRHTSVLVLCALLAACQDTAPSDISGPADAVFAKNGNNIVGAVYTQTNSTSGNAVLVYPRSSDGSLGAYTSVSTGGTGSGAGLGSQGSVTLSENGNWLLVTNAGSNQVSSFSVGANGALTLRSNASSGGTMPISVTVHDDLV
ncbi:MAG: beta-propeller fold lactonase family protein, partial [Gemmatimonas sp.]